MCRRLLENSLTLEVENSFFASGMIQLEPKDHWIQSCLNVSSMRISTLYLFHSFHCLIASQTIFSYWVSLWPIHEECSRPQACSWEGVTNKYHHSLFSIYNSHLRKGRTLIHNQSTILTPTEHNIQPLSLMLDNIKWILLVMASYQILSPARLFSSTPVHPSNISFLFGIFHSNAYYAMLIIHVYISN